MRGDGRYPLTEADLLSLSIGAALLGTGGGGNPYVGMLRSRELLRKGATVEVLPLDALADDAWVGEVGGIGAPVVGVEKIEQGEECYRALRAVEEVSGVRISALICAEIGGANSMEPVITAAQAGLPVLDGDGMGRAFPEVQMTTFFIYGAKPAPAAIADDKGNTVVFRDVLDMYWLERFARDTAVAMGAGAGLAIAPMRGDFVRRAAIPGTMTQALEIGRTILDARAKRQDVVGRIIAATGATLFFTGKVTDIRRELLGGFARGEAQIAGSGEWHGSEARIAIQNENLVLWVDGRPVIMVPDLIINLDLETGEPITTEVLRYGQRLAVIGLPAHELLKTPEAMAVVGPGAFGYPDLVFSPLAGGRVGNGKDVR
ncbi:DUF917 domain-containing protein [Rubellimicrobium sp. CFH 75288]|uniref:DUF917 domain-containing protein n=1 Tax=Rubellimicrobium sp. CFH 75288 TaxID=2697034 RepID=UPI001412D721|nr:DUF917 domain-containing protein [Rubellimicrobium sp. CFH 75288]NAZ35706.1 DUF917 family protein [Rubellimicrobium sp. CFH 75288]